MHAPHVVNPPTTVDPDEAVRAFREELGDDAVIPCTAGTPAPRGIPAPKSAQCGAPAVWVTRKPCGHAGYLCDPCARLQWSTWIETVTCNVCAASFLKSLITWRPL
jgi:hypothetical protein